LSSRASRPTKQNLAKSVSVPAQEKNFKIFLPRLKEKIKTRQNTGNTDSKGK